MGASPSGAYPETQSARRSLRKTASFPVWVRNEQLGPTWEEEVETQVVSRYGAGLRCRHFVQAGSILVIVRKDDGQRANAQVKYSRYHPDGRREIGIEIIDKDDFWGLDWNGWKSPSAIVKTAVTSTVMWPEFAIAPGADSDISELASTGIVLEPIQHAVDAEEVAADRVANESAEHTETSLPQDMLDEAVPIAISAVSDEEGVEVRAPSLQAETDSLEIAPPIVSDETSVPISALEIPEAVRVVVVSPASESNEIIDTALDAANDGSATNKAESPAQQAPEVIPVTISTVTDRHDLESNPPSAQAETKIEGAGIELVSDETEADARTRSIRDDTEEQVRPSYQVTSRVGENLPPSFLSFYGLNEQPFDVTPDPEYLYLTQTHREALNSLSQGIVNVRGFMTLIAEPGMGKTTLLNKLMEDLRDSTRIVFLFQTQCNSRELFRYLLSELGVENVAVDVVTMHKALNEILFQEMLMGRRFLLVIDEAQNLRDSVLETIRLLSDFETTHTKLIQIVLAGQSQLAERLMKPGLSQLRQRIAVLTSLQPLSASETAQYVTHRLRRGGATGESVFTPEALTLIAERSQGIPRNINNLCFNALLSGYSERVNPIDSALVQRVIAKSDLESLVRRPQ